MTLGLIGIVLSLALLITLAYRGMSIIIAAPLCALVAVLFSGAPVLVNYTDTFMPALANFVAQYFPLFLTGAIFGKLMTVTGYATDLATFITRWVGPQRAMLATVLTTALLTYGGISVFVVVFVMFPMARELFRQAGIPRRPPSPGRRDGRDGGARRRHPHGSAAPSRGRRGGGRLGGSAGPAQPCGPVHPDRPGVHHQLRLHHVALPRHGLGVPGGV